MEVRYARNGDVHIAYYVLGSGERDIVLVSTWFVPIEAMFDGPAMAHALEQIGGIGRLILFDRRGIGLSDPVSGGSPPTLEQWMSDTLVVMNQVGAHKAALLGLDPSGAQVAMLLAATHPERVSALVLFNAHARFVYAPDYPIGVPAEVQEKLAAGILEDWMSGSAGLDVLAPRVGAADPLRSWWVRSRRRGASPATIRSVLGSGMVADLRSVLPSIQAPTLVIHRSSSRSVPVEHGRYLSQHITGAKYVELPGDDSLFFLGDADRLLEELEEFLTGSRSAVEQDRVLATVMFTDIVNSTSQLADMGDKAWRDLLGRHHEIVRRQLERFRGREVKTTGDGFLAVFDGPARAIRCGLAIRSALRQVGLEARVGLHTGEVEMVNEDVAGIAVHIAQRVSSHAGPGEVVVSRTVADLVTGSGIDLAEKGEVELKGLPGSWRLLLVRDP